MIILDTYKKQGDTAVQNYTPSNIHINSAYMKTASNVCIWKQIQKFNYEINQKGEVRNILTKKRIKSRSGGTSVYKVFQVHLGKSKTKSLIVHREVAIAFIPNPKNKSQVNHIDGDKLNNNVSNLEWVTPKENMAHALKTGLYKKYNNQTYKGKFGKEHNRSIKIECNGITYNGISEASRKTGINISTISISIKEGRALRNGMHFQLSYLT